jgi:type I restriction enzyme, S subunit
MTKDVQIFSLDELGYIGRGKSRHRPRNDPSLYYGKYPFIQTSDVKKAKFYLDKYSQTYNEKGLAQSKLWDKETLLITIAANIADTAILNIKACFPDSIVGFIPNDKICNIKYIKYYFEVFQNAFQQISQGSTQDNLSVEKLLSLKIPIPEISKQNKIVSILESYDELINNNLKVLSLLEKSMNITFEEYFYRFKIGNKKLKINSENNLPFGWKNVMFYQFIELEKGIEPGADAYEYEKNDENIEFLRVGDLSKRSSELYVPINLCKKINADYEDVLISLDGSPGMVKFGLKGSYSSGIRKVHSKSNKEISNVFIYNLLKSQSIQKMIQAYSTGTTILHAGSVIKKLEFVLPDNETLKIYNESENDKFELSILLIKLNQSLLRIKEILLPRILLGKINKL